MISKKLFGITDFTLLLFVMIISVFGLVLLYSATNQDIDIVIRQGTKLSFCFVIMLLIGSLDSNKLRLITPYLYTICLLLLVMTLFWGHDTKGAKRWIVFFGFSFQVSEIFKIIIPLTLAWFLSYSDYNEIDLKKLFVSFIIIFLPLVFILKQPDLGTSAIILTCGLITIFLAGIGYIYMCSLLGLFLIVTPLMWKFFLLPYQKVRILTLIDPNTDPLGSGYHIIQSKIAVGSGGFFGKGFLNGTQSQLEFLPERGTDFIFSVFAEEFGFLGVVILLLLYLVIVIRCLHITSRAKNYFSRLVSGSITTIFILLIITNISMTVGLLPVVGVTLPLLSLGGSSLLSIFMAFGIMLSINRRN
ncbi:MAG: rod shape-determining protein RodA [Gammaproteobacteria bacterium]|nr:rod shape-determining protein RodA [Gammaproteobacteria bacterium]MBT7603000.1 rod shape-determining protein RodA [Gammaproteobacteria bacterium]